MHGQKKDSMKTHYAVYLRTNVRIIYTHVGVLWVRRNANVMNKRLLRSPWRTKIRRKKIEYVRFVTYSMLVLHARCWILNGTNNKLARMNYPLSVLSSWVYYFLFSVGVVVVPLLLFLLRRCALLNLSYGDDVVGRQTKDDCVVCYIFTLLRRSQVTCTLPIKTAISGLSDCRP